MEPVIIIGGGVAGLSCLNALLDQGINARLLEAKTIGFPKICGEFLAPQAAALLQNWEIHPGEPIYQASFLANDKKLEINLKPGASALERAEAEKMLANRAKNKGGQIQENVTITRIIPSTQTSPFYFILNTGEEIAAQSAIFASGKLTAAAITLVKNTTTNPNEMLPYFGIKFHIKKIIEPHKLLMHCYKGAYLGLVPLSTDKSNCACLVKQQIINKAGSAKQFLYDLISREHDLQFIFDAISFDSVNWMEARAPNFGLKQLPTWPRAYWIGDAIAALPPAVGLGFTHAITSAILAAEFYAINNTKGYNRKIKNQIKTKLRIGKLLHYLLLNPKLGIQLLPLINHNPWFINWILSKIGY